MAAGWFVENWSLPHNGRWIICHFERAGPFNNNGVEGHNGSIKTFVLNQSGQKTTQTAPALVASTCAYLSHKSEEGRHDLVQAGTSSMFKSLPSFRNTDIEKLKKMHPRAAQLITCIQLQQEWQEQMDLFMEIGNDDLSLYERLNLHQRNHRQVPKLSTDVFLDTPVDFYFPSEHLLCRIDRQRSLTITQLHTQVKKYLKRHLLYADKSCGQNTVKRKRRRELLLSMNWKWRYKRFTISGSCDFGRD